MSASVARRWLPAALVAVLAVVAVGWLLAPRPAPPGEAAAPPQATAPRGTTATPPPAEAQEPLARASIRIPRPAEQQPTRNLREVLERAAAEAALRPRAEGSGPVDRREGGGGDPQLVEDIHAGMDLVAEDIEECLDAWSEVEPAFTGRVVLRFQLDAQGLQEVWVEEHEDVPPGPLSCFGAAVYEVDWADITEAPLEVSFPFEVEAGEEPRDAASAPQDGAG